MAYAATVVPPESDLLCEECGYTLNGLPADGNCPECGKPIEQSRGTHRQYTEFESSPSARTFFRTTREVIFRPTRFYRTLLTRSGSPRALIFQRIHLAGSSLLMFLAARGHLEWFGGSSYWLRFSGNVSRLIVVASVIGLAAGFVGLAVFGVMRLAAWLSAIEARYWGMRLPHAVVLRALAFHTAHYLPVGLAALSVTRGYQFLLWQGIIDRAWDTAYLVTLCGTVVVTAVYLFMTYWIAMKNMMYANR